MPVGELVADVLVVAAARAPIGRGLDLTLGLLLGPGGGHSSRTIIAHGSPVTLDARAHVQSSSARWPCSCGGGPARAPPDLAGAAARSAQASFLTGPSERRPATVALGYVSARTATFGLDQGDLDGLRLTRAYRWGAGAVHLQWEQVYRGIPVFGPGLRANVDAQGRLINVGAGAQPDPHVSSIVPRLPAPKGERATLTIFGDRLAWRVLVRADPTHVYDTVVDATTAARRSTGSTSCARRPRAPSTTIRERPSAAPRSTRSSRRPAPTRG